VAASSTARMSLVRSGFRPGYVGELGRSPRRPKWPPGRGMVKCRESSRAPSRGAPRYARAMACCTDARQSPPPLQSSVTTGRRSAPLPTMKTRFEPAGRGSPCTMTTTQGGALIPGGRGAGDSRAGGEASARMPSTVGRRARARETRRAVASTRARS